MNTQIKCYAGARTFQLSAGWSPTDPVKGFGPFRACQRHAIRRRGKTMIFTVSRVIKCPRT